MNDTDKDRIAFAEAAVKRATERYNSALQLAAARSDTSDPYYQVERAQVALALAEAQLEVLRAIIDAKSE